ncbi:hypothetical protein DEU56DRAFT_928435, partial [Suillus clintonianus]|uniref:uncharacterized protein n=1 Tax=Suillus clintonianus TaxID=1904413 RepID=UPI001B87DF3F
LAHDAGLSHEQLDRLIHLIHRSRMELFTLKNRKDVRDTWDAASFKMTPFTKVEVTVPFRGVNQTFPLFHRSLWDWVTDLLQDPQVGPNFVFDAQRLSKFNGEKFVRFIHEPWTANAFWEYQSKIPPDAKPLAFILYADKAKLSSFGRAKGQVKEDKQHSGKPAFVNFKNAVWHASFLKILECLGPLSDYEEQAVMALIRGLMGKFPCPVCLVPRDELSNTLKVFPLRTCTGTKALLARARESSTLEAREQILSSQSLRDVDSSFGILEHTDVHRALSHDKLHFNDEGLFSDHTWPELQKWVERLGRQAAVQIDTFFQSIPRWRNLNHFDQVVSVSFSDGTKYEDISKLIVFAAHNAYLMLRCIRSYTEFNMYASLEVHTEDTINNGREALSKFTGLMDKYIEDTAEMSEKSWNFPKKHLSAHLFDDMRRKVFLETTAPSRTKKMHGPLKDAYQDRTNFKNFAEQILRYNHDSLIAEYIRNKLDHLDTQNISVDRPESPDTTLQETDNSDDIDVDSTEPTDAQHFTLGSKRAAMSFTLIEAGSPGNPVFDRFRIKLNDFLNHAFAANGIPFPGGRWIQLVASDMIVEHQFLRVNFESLVDWRVSTDYLRCTPMFHGSPQYNCVILQTDTGIIFGKLMLIFTCTVGDVQYPVTLVLPYDRPVGVRPQKDKDFQFWRVKTKPRASAETSAASDWSRILTSSLISESIYISLIFISSIVPSVIAFYVSESSSTPPIASLLLTFPVVIAVPRGHPPHAQNIQFGLRSRHNIYSSVSRATFDHWHNVLDARMVTVNSAPLSGEARIALGNTKKHLEKLERLLAEFQAATVNGAPLSGEARRVIEEEARVAHADRQRDEAEARRRVVLESYDELSKYLAAIEFLRDPGGHLVLTPIPNQIQHYHSPYSANPSITVEPPRLYNQSHHHYTSSLSSGALPPALPALPPPLVVSVLAQAASMTHLISLHPSSHLPNNLAMTVVNMTTGLHSPRSSVRATSQDIEDLLLDAATDERSALNARDQQPQSPRAVLAAH